MLIACPTAVNRADVGKLAASKRHGVKRTRRGDEAIEGMRDEGVSDDPRSFQLKVKQTTCRGNGWRCLHILKPF